MTVGAPSVRRTVTRLAVGAVLAFVAVFVVGGAAVGWALRRVEEQDLVQRLARTRLFLLRQIEVAEATIREYAWWDDTWRFIDEPGSAWARRFVQDNYIGWLPTRYGDSHIAIWALDRRRVFLWSDSASRGLEDQLERPEAFALADSARAAGGLVVGPRGGLYLAAVSVVVHTADQDATGPSHGFVSLAFPITPAVLSAWSADLQERIHVEADAAGAARLGDSSEVRMVAGGDSVEVRFAVRGLFGAPLAVGTVTAAVGAHAGIRVWALAVIAAAALVGVVVLVGVGVTSARVLVQPLERIAQALAAMRAGGRLSPLAQPARAREWEVFVGAFNDTVEALRASEALYGSIFAHAGDALFVLEGPGGTIIDANPEAARLTGCDRAQLVGRALPEFLEPGGAGAGGVRRIRRCGAEPVTVEIVSGEVDAGGRRLTLASVRDLTERLALEAQLREAQKMELMGRLAGGVAHDFNNLLGGVLVSASALRELLGPVHPAGETVETIERAARRGADLTRQLLSLARRDPARRHPVHVGELVLGVVRLCNRTFGHAVRFDVHLAEDDLVVLGDTAQLEQALLNLCINGRDAMAGGGTITLRVRAEASEAGEPPPDGTGAARVAVIEVEDTGPGLSDEVREHLFEPFFTTKPRGRGTGLGLPTAYGTVKVHGGTITAGNAPGGGARFTIRLPLAEDAVVAAPAPSRADVLRGGSETILLVDDEEALRRSVKHVLESLGYRVVEAANGRAAVALVAERPAGFDLVLLDVLMPEMGGVETFRALRGIRADVPILVMTGYATGAALQELTDGGAEGVLVKPFELAELVGVVRRILDAPRSPSARP